MDGAADDSQRSGSSSPTSDGLLAEADQRVAFCLLADNFASCLAALLFSLMTGLSLAPLSTVLAATRRSDQPVKALHRYLSTARHVIAWHLGDPLDPNCQAGQSSVAVRRAHAVAAASVQPERRGVGADFPADDMRTVQTAFVAYALLHSRMFGIRLDGGERQQLILAAYARHWHRISLSLGMTEADSALSGDLRSCRSACGDVQLRLISALQAPPPQFLPLAEALSAGICLIAGDRHSPLLLRFLLLPLRLLLSSFSPPAVVAVFLEAASAPDAMRRRALASVGYRPVVHAALAGLLRCLLRLLACAPRRFHRALFARACRQMHLDLPVWWLADTLRDAR
ncbi:hypothetical protein BOX15_Mlig022926g1 [Macrostomum lignano]|uniref:DUF2236 domain-containing protein n=2 Tax=Macrostomum lignano TaxID=282301 RepID=A0A1I8G6Y2_9PLAT|nr:hypothetical protein BOX15_Mlig022926g1 [Macrostomum lignano]